MKLCMIGNSQGAALVEGLDRLAEQGTLPHAVDYFLVVGGGGPRLDFDGDRIRVPADGVESNLDLSAGHIRIDGYDALLVSGVGIYALRKDNPHPLNTHFLHATTAASDDVFSWQFLDRLMRAYVREVPSTQNIAQLRRIFAGRILVQPFPIPVESLLDQADFALPYDRETIRAIFRWHAALQDNELRRVAGEIENCAVVSYPAEWIGDGFTPERFGSYGDAWHMNADFGAFYMARVFDTLADA